MSFIFDENHKINAKQDYSRRILFIENREKTELWKRVAKILVERGYTIAWIVQNPAFMEDLPGQVFRLKFPTQKQLVSCQDFLNFWPSLITDRGRQHFRSGTSHYMHYSSLICEILNSFKPNLIVSEATLFHELQTYQIAQEKNIPFIHPICERYPQDRIVLFEGLSQNAFLQSGQQYDESLAKDYINRVLSGAEKLSYLPPDRIYKRMQKKIKWFGTRWRVLFGRFLGEKYNTPSLAQKFYLYLNVKVHSFYWDSACRDLNEHEVALLYPMQMQPENNLDVWGRPYDDQVDVIQRILKSTPTNVTIALKSNPKPGLEMTKELIDLARNESRICLLPRSEKMSDAMKNTLGAITICGTVGFEALFGKGRCVSICHPIITENFPLHSASSPEEAALRILNEPLAGVGSQETGLRLLELIWLRSFEGVVSDPVNLPSCISKDNVSLVADAIEFAFRKAITETNNTGNVSHENHRVCSSSHVE